MTNIFGVPFNDHLWPPGTPPEHLMYPAEEECPQMAYRGWCPVCWRWWDFWGVSPVRCLWHPQYWLEVRPKARLMHLLPEPVEQLALFSEPTESGGAA